MDHMFVSLGRVTDYGLVVAALSLDTDAREGSASRALDKVPGNDADPDGMYRRLVDVVRQIATARDIANMVELPLIDRPNGVLAVGLGGSSAGAELASVAYGDVMNTPFSLLRRRYLPGWVDERSLVLATSWSGDTDETVAAAAVSADRRARVIAIASGGALADLAMRRGFPLLRTPGGMMPRLALPLMFALTRYALRSSGVVADDVADKEFETVIEDVVQACSLERDRASNPARRIAEALDGHWITIFAGGGLRAVGRRWREQINENAKVWACYDELPAAHHNALIAIRHAVDAGGAVVVLETADDEGLDDVVFSNARGRLIRVRFRLDSTPPAQLGAALVGDFVSLYMAYLRKIDPTPVDSVNVIKRRLALDLTTR